MLKLCPCKGVEFILCIRFTGSQIIFNRVRSEGGPRVNRKRQVHHLSIGNAVGRAVKEK